MCEERRAATTVVGGRPVIIMQRLNAPSTVELTSDHPCTRVAS